MLTIPIAKTDPIDQIGDGMAVETKTFHVSIMQVRHRGRETWCNKLERKDDAIDRELNYTNIHPPKTVRGLRSIKIPA